MKNIFFSILLLIVTASGCKKGDSSNSINPVVLSIQPKNPKVGDIVTITGTGFGKILIDISITIGDKGITINSVDDTEIKFTYTADIPTGDLTVSVKGAKAKISDPEGSKITKPNTSTAIVLFTGMSPSTAKVGETITLSGDNFSTTLTDNVVKFVSSTPGLLVGVTAKTATKSSLTVEVPNGAGTGIVTVEVNKITALLTSNFNGVFTLAGSSGGGSGTGTSGQTTLLLKDYMILSNDIAVDATGNAYVLSPAVRAGIPRLVRVGADGNNIKLFAPAEFGYVESDFMGAVGVTSDKAGNIYVLTASSLKREYKIWKISSPDGKPVLFRSTSDYNFSNSLAVKSLQVTSADEFYFLVSTNPVTVYKIDNSGKVSPYLNSDGSIFDGTVKPLPSDISIDQNDNLFVSAELSDGTFKAIYKFSPAKVRSVVYSSTANSSTYGNISQTTFKSIFTISVSPDGNLIFIGDANLGYLSKMDISANNVTKTAGSGQGGSPLFGANNDVRIIPNGITYDSKNQAVFILSGITGLQRVKL